MRFWGTSVLVPVIVGLAACHPNDRPAQLVNHPASTARSSVRALEQGIRVRGMAFGADGTHLFTGGFDGVIAPSSPKRGAWIWDLETGARTKTIAGLEFESLAVSRDLIAFVYARSTVHVLNLVTLQELFVGLPGAAQASVAISPDGSRIASIGEDEHVHVWKVDGSEQSFDSKRSFLFAVAFTHDSRQLIIGGADGTTGIYSLDGTERAKLVGIDPAHPDDKDVWSLAVSPDGRWIATGCGDGVVRIWNAAAVGEVDTPAFALPGPREMVHTVAFSGDGRVIAAGAGGGTARAWTFPEGNLLGVFTPKAHESAEEKGITAVALSWDGTTLAVGDGGGSIRFYRLAL